MALIVETVLQGLNALYLDACSVYRIVSTKLHVFSDSQLDDSGLRLKEWPYDNTYHVASFGRYKKTKQFLKNCKSPSSLAELKG